MREYGRPGGPMHEKAICQHDIEKLQSFYWKKYRVRLSKREAEKILIAQMSGRERYDFAHMTPHKGM